MTGEKAFSPKEGQQVAMPATVTRLLETNRSLVWTKRRHQAPRGSYGAEGLSPGYWGQGRPLTSSPQRILERGRALCPRRRLAGRRVQVGGCGRRHFPWWTLQEGGPAVRCNRGPFLARTRPSLSHTGNK